MDNGAGLTSFRRYTWWAVPGTVVCVLVLAYGSWALDGDVPLWARAPVVPALGVHAVAAAVLLGGAMEDRTPVLRPLAGWLVTACLAAAALAVLPLARHNYGLWAVAPAVTVAIVAVYLSAAGKLWLIGGAVVLALVPGSAVNLLAGDEDLAYAALFPACLTAFTVWTVLGPLWAWRIAGRLDRARRLEAELAVKDERLRFASDLHDIQGHHLQVIALKAELASRIAEVDPACASGEMQEIRRLCTDALRDTRAVVRGIRRTTLDGEIANATRVLAAAGIDARMNLEPAAVQEELSDSVRQLLGLVMREATTNVLRHSQARHAEVDYRVSGELALLRISNDQAHAHPGTGDGTGLLGLAERLRSAGGELTWEREDGDRFVVTATLPVQRSEE
ncbi:two-component system sensor histidine kinase DesK [Streptomyces canus]|uniref:sensor histidine kinase n=1 Tax=Streptomyces canus TaxID=58343 RepID=UPI0027828CCD|nr:histidine kinase [Streptomyces canus]MDQ0600159.1 two-component system sensor histidine kinase DesK [Streptomyces canus]